MEQKWLLCWTSKGLTHLSEGIDDSITKDQCVPYLVSCLVVVFLIALRNTIFEINKFSVF